MKLGILYAMEKEAASLLGKLDAQPLGAQAGMPLYALPGGHILCVGGVGKVNAAMAAQMLIDRCWVDGILNAGCAGALSDLPVGTVVAATHCVQHDVDTSLAGDEPGFVSTVNCTEFPCQLPKAPGLTQGVVATGDWFAHDPGRARAIQERYGAAVCDMEAGAAAQVCLRNGLPFLCLKAVSDHLFAPDQGREYEENLSAAMAALDGAVTAVCKEWEA